MGIAGFFEEFRRSDWKPSHKSQTIVIPRSGATRNLVFSLETKNEILRGVYPAESGAQNDNRMYF